MEPTVNLFAQEVAHKQGQYVLRPYQAEAVQAAVDYLRAKHDKNGLIVCPTGAGKSLIVAGIVKEVNAPTLILQPSKEILAQNVEKFRVYGGRCGIYSASVGEKKWADVTFATVGSIVNKKAALDRFEYVIIDECHLVNSKTEIIRDKRGNKIGERDPMLKQVIKHMGSKVIGLTATPYRLGNTTDMKTGMRQSVLKMLNRTSPRIFSDIIYYVQNGQLFQEGHLCKLVYHAVDVINRAALQKNSTGADFTEASLREQYERHRFKERIVNVVNRLFHPEVNRKNALVFTRFVEEAKYVASMIPGAAIVDATTKDAERDRIIKGFKAGRIRCVCNVGILTTGFDYPELEAVVLARPTMSLALYYQMVGRCVRPHPNKPNAMVIDMGGNLAQFGKVEDLVLSELGGWHVQSNGKILTGVPFGDKFKARR